MSAPVIGLTVDWEGPGGYSRFPWYALRENYAEAVTRGPAGSPSCSPTSSP